MKILSVILVLFFSTIPADKKTTPDKSMKDNNVPPPDTNEAEKATEDTAGTDRNKVALKDKAETTGEKDKRDSDQVLTGTTIPSANIFLSVIDKTQVRPNILEIGKKVFEALEGNRYQNNMLRFTNYLADNLKAQSVLQGIRNSPNVDPIMHIQPQLKGGLEAGFGNTTFISIMYRMLDVLMPRLQFSESMDGFISGKPNPVFDKNEAIDDAFTVPKKPQDIKVTEEEVGFRDAVKLGRRLFSKPGNVPGILVVAIKVIIDPNNII